MANSYSLGAAKETLRCGRVEASALEEALGEDEENDRFHGIEMEYDEDEDGEHIHHGELLLHSTWNFDPSRLSPHTMGIIGEILAFNEKEFIEIGVALTCDKTRPGNFGGLYCRIYADGTFRYAELDWEKGESQRPLTDEEIAAE